MRRLPSRLLPLALLGAFLALTACRKAETAAEAGIRSQTLIVGNLAEPKDLDPQVIDAYTDMNIAAALFEGLTGLDEKTSHPVPGVAERWDISPDGLVYTFHLRPTARWSNGDPVTSRDFAWSLQRILTPAFAAGYSYMLWPIKNAEAYNAGKLTDFSAVGIATPDDATLRLTLERPTPALLTIAAHNTWYPVHRATIEKFGKMEQPGTAWTRPGNLVSNGPFRLREWVTNDHITVEKNPHYWDTVRLNAIKFLPVENGDVEERNFRAGQIHITYDLPVSKIAGYRAQRPSPLRNDPFLSLLYLNFNTTKPPFDQPAVRRALALAIDRDAISRSVLDGVWPAAHAFVPPGSGDYVSTASVPTDFAEARRLLASAGFPDGQGFPTVPLQVLNDLRQPKIAEALQATWQRELGIHVTIEMNEQKTWLQNQQAMTHTLGTLGWVADYPDPITFLSLCQTGNGNNWTGWSNPAYDRLLEEASATADPAARFALLQKAEAFMLAEAPASPLVIRTRTYLLHPAVRDWDPAPVGLHLYKKVYLQGAP